MNTIIEKIKSIVKKISENQIYSTVAFLLSIIMLFTATTVSVAWFFNQKILNPDLSFTAGSPDDYVLYTITCGNEASMATVEETDTIGTNGFFVNDLQLGKITNLGMLENSNFIYYAIKVPKAEGGNITLSVSYQNTDDTHFEIYVPVRDGNGELTYENDNLITTLYGDVNDLNAIKELEADDTFIKYRVAVSETNPEGMSVDALNSLFTEDAKNLHVDEDGNPIMQSLTYNTGSDEGFYYVYIKFEPNVSLYSGFIDYLWHSMPFGLCYDVRITFSVAP